MKNLIKKVFNKFGKSDLSKKVITNTSWMLFQNIYTMIIAVFVTAFVARYYGPSGYGTLNYVIAFTGLFSGLAVFGTNHIAIKDFTQGEHDDEKVFGTLFIIRIIFSIIVFIVCQIAVYIVSNGDKVTQIITLLFNIKTIFAVTDIITYYANAKIKNKYISIYKIISITIFSILKILCVILKLNIVYLAGTYLIEGIIYALLLFTSIKKINNNKTMKKWYFDKKYAIEVIKKSSYYALASIMVTIYLKIDQVMLGIMIEGKTQVGIYSAAVRIAEMWTFIPIAVITSLKPIIIDAKEKNEKDYINKLQKLYNIISLLCIVFAIGMMIFGNLVIYILYGVEYASANIPMYIIVWGLLFGELGNVHYIWMICENKQKYSLIYSFTGCITNIIANLILIPICGIIGAAIATCFSQIAANFISFMFNKETRILPKMLLKSLNPINGIKDLLNQKN